jgi:DNA-binding CsgD family transcriptional regulator
MDGIEQLTPVERECLDLVGRGFQSKEIAAATGRASKTVDKHIENACRKLGVGSRRQAARLYLAAGLRSGSVEAPFPLSVLGQGASAGDRKGGANAAHTLRSPLDHVGGAGGDLRRSGGEPGAEGGGLAPASDDETPADGPFAARSRARNLLHRARSPLRERSTADVLSRPEGTALRRLLMIPVIAAVTVAVLAAILGGAIQLQLAVQAIDRTLSSR